MPLEAPNLDNRSFFDIVAEARTLIPRYTPEWTDHNDSDPGVTLIQLFAWLADILLYRLNQVPERNYIKFLQLLGIELKPAQPARADLKFTLARNDLDSVIIPRGTQVAVSGGEGEPLIFETDLALVALGASLKAVYSFDGFSYAPETTKNATTGQCYTPFGLHAREGSALLLGFDSPLDFTREQVNLAVYIHSRASQSEGQDCDLDMERMPVPATLAWEFWGESGWQPLSLDKDETRAFTRSGHIYFRGPGAAIKRDRLRDVSEERLYWIRVRLERSAYENPPCLETIRTNTIRATQAITVRDEVVGGSNGMPNRVFRLANTPVIVRERVERTPGAHGALVTITSLRLEVDEGSGLMAWQEVDDFFDSTPTDPHYMLNRTTGEIRFGDGEHGRIPVANPANRNGNIVAREYRFGGGRRGNTGAETITELQTSVDFVESVTNLYPAFGGSEEETVAEAKLRAPRELKSKGRAVTAEDFERLAQHTPGVRICRAKALPLHHPEFPDSQIPGVVTVIVVPDADAPAPVPGEATLHIVCAHLNKHRLLTSEVFVVPPTYRKVKIKALLAVRPQDDLAEVKREVESRLKQYFHPLKGGENGAGWEFGRDIFYSDVYRVVLQTPGVDRIQNNGLFISLDREEQPFCQDVPIDPGVLLYSEEHDIRVSYPLRN